MNLETGVAKLVCARTKSKRRELASQNFHLCAQLSIIKILRSFEVSWIIFEISDLT